MNCRSENRNRRSRKGKIQDRNVRIRLLSEEMDLSCDNVCFLWGGDLGPVEVGFFPSALLDQERPSCSFGGECECEYECKCKCKCKCKCECMPGNVILATSPSVK
jgi:hypothetical protein